MLISSSLWGQNLSRSDLTPTFYQCESGTDFPYKGRYYCGPVAAADSMVYLSQALKLPQLVAGTAHESQVGVIKELAGDMSTDPARGTSMDGFLAGIETYVKKQGCSVSRLEIVTLDHLNLDHEKRRISTRLEPAWINSALKDPACAVMLSVAWYYTVPATGIPGYQAGPDDVYYRHHGGHWVSLVGEGPTPLQFYTHNPGLTSDRQLSECLLTLSPLPSDLTLIRTENGTDNLDGFYRADGAGFPQGDKARGVVEAVVVLSVRPGP